jgi:tRNA 2-thiouridine synthesizing protein E
MKLNLDKEGFLRDLSDWNPDVAQLLAKNEEITLSDSHWQVINLVRDYYQQYQISPATRVLVKITRKKLGEDKGNSIYLMQLFTGKPAKLVSKIAGLPKPPNCD